MFLSAFSPLYQGNGTMATELPVLHVAFAAASASARWACHARVRKSNSRTPFFTHYFLERVIPFVDITGFRACVSQLQCTCTCTGTKRMPRPRSTPAEKAQRGKGAGRVRSGSACAKKPTAQEDSCRNLYSKFSVTYVGASVAVAPSTSGDSCELGTVA